MSAALGTCRLSRFFVASTSSSIFSTAAVFEARHAGSECAIAMASAAVFSSVKTPKSMHDSLLSSSWYNGKNACGGIERLSQLHS